MSILYGVLPGILISLGMGGGSLLIFILNMFEDYSQQEIQYINLWAYICASIFSIYSYGKEGNIDKRLLMIILPITIISCIVASFFSRNLETQNLKQYFGIFLIIMGIWQVLQISYKYIKKKKEKNKIKEV